MSDVLTVVGIIGGGLVGLGGLVAAAYYGLRLLELLRERRPVSVRLRSVGVGQALYANRRRMLMVDVRLFNPGATTCSVSEACLTSTKSGGLILHPIEEVGYGGWRDKQDRSIVLAPKQHSELTLGIAIKESPFGDEMEEVQLVVALDSGVRVRSKSFQVHIDWPKLFR